jgi:hypothetical protein
MTTAIRIRLAAVLRLGLTAALLAFVPVAASQAEHHEGMNPCAGETANPCNPCAGKVTDPNTGKPANPCNPCAGKPANPCNPCAGKPANPCNPCAGKNPCNPCAGKNPCNPCAGKPANPCNPCGSSSRIDPSRFKQPEGVAIAGTKSARLVAVGEKLWNDRGLGTSGLACATCHIDKYGQMNASFAAPYPHFVAMPAQQAGVSEVSAAEMVNFCMIVPMMDEPLAWDSQELAALAAYVEEIRPGYRPVGAAGANPCNPCAGANPCNPCAVRNPCGAR